MFSGGVGRQSRRFLRVIHTPMSPGGDSGLKKGGSARMWSKRGEGASRGRGEGTQQAPRRSQVSEA